MLKCVFYKSISIRNIKDQILRILIKPVGLKYYWDIQGKLHEPIRQFIYLSEYVKRCELDIIL